MASASTNNNTLLHLAPQDFGPCDASVRLSRQTEPSIAWRPSCDQVRAPESPRPFLILTSSLYVAHCRKRDPCDWCKPGHRRQANLRPQMGCLQHDIKGETQ